MLEDQRKETEQIEGEQDDILEWDATLRAVKPDAMGDPHEFRSLLIQSKDFDATDRKYAALRVAAHRKALELNPDVALGPDLNNFWTLFVPEKSCYLVEGRPINEKSAMLFQGALDALTHIGVLAEDARSIIMEARENPKNFEAFEKSNDLLIKLYKEMRAKGFNHKDIWG